MSNRTLLEVFKDIDYVNRYQEICNKYNDNANRMEEDVIEYCGEIFAKVGYKPEYSEITRRYWVSATCNGYEVGLQISLNDGMVEPMLSIKRFDISLSPNGSFELIAEEIDQAPDKPKYTLPVYTSVSELEIILLQIFLIVEDLKLQLFVAPKRPYFLECLN